MNQSIISNSDKLIISQNICNDILETEKQLEKLKLLYKKIQIDLPVHSNANFRDSYVHYDKLSTTLLEEEIICQKHAVDEHLQRSIKDACVHIAGVYITVANRILLSSNLYKKDNLNYQKKLEELTSICEFVFEEDSRFKSSLKVLTVENFEALIKEMLERFFKEETKMFKKNSYSCGLYKTYLKDCLFDYYSLSFCQYLDEQKINNLRECTHLLSNHILSNRSASAKLIKTYKVKDDNAFDEFCGLIDKMHKCFVENYLLGILYLYISQYYDFKI